MKGREKIAVCGGGHVAHSLVAVLSDFDDVVCLTRRPGLWASKLQYVQEGSELRSCRCNVRAVGDPARISDAQIIFIALPKFAVYEELQKIDPYLLRGQMVCVIHAPAGLEAIASGFSIRGIDLIGFQRVPYISRIIDYGHSVSISSPRSEHKLVVSRSSLCDFWSKFCTERFGGKAAFLSSFKTFAFSNAGALLHPARIVELFRDWTGKPYARNPFFYAEWSDESSRLYVDSDAEMRKIMAQCPQIDMATDYESAFDHYGVSSISQLTNKLRSIPSFRSILSPMKRHGAGWVPDFSSRYFTEDIPFGLAEIISQGNSVRVEMPVLKSMMARLNLIQDIKVIG